MAGRFDIALGKKAPKPEPSWDEITPREEAPRRNNRMISVAAGEIQGRAIAAEQNENIIRGGELTAAQLAEFNAGRMPWGASRDTLTPEELERFNNASNDLIRTRIAPPRLQLQSTPQGTNAWFDAYQASFPAGNRPTVSLNREHDNAMLTQLQTMVLNSIEFAITNRPSFTETLRQHHSPDSFARDIASFHVCMPRRYGNSRIVYQLMQAHPDALLIVLTNDMAGEARRNGVDRDRILSVGSRSLYGRNYPLVIADGANYMTRQQLDNMYMGCRADFYVLMG